MSSSEDLSRDRQIYMHAHELLRSSASRQNYEALAELGHIYETGGIKDVRTGKLHKLTNVRIETARERYQAAADQNCQLAQNYLGALYFNHDKDFVNAVKYFKMAI